MAQPGQLSQATHTSAKEYAGQAYIRKADAARLLGDMREVVDGLTEGFRIAGEIDSMQRFSEAGDVISNMPDAWKRETAVQNLQKDISHAIVVARQ